MCRMMAVGSKVSVKADWIVQFESLAAQGKTRCDMPEPGHHDGWGMVSYFRENFPEYLGREPHSATEDDAAYKKGAQFIEQSKCKSAMVHFRKISVGKPAISNTHPFLYKEWAFCHNGTIFDSDQIPLAQLKPGGVTDSERFFLYLMEHLDPKDPRGSIKKSILEIKKKFKYTSLTFLLTDGKTLYAYRDCDPQYDDYYTLHTALADGSRIFSSEPLAKIPSWKALKNAELLSFNCQNPEQLVE